MFKKLLFGSILLLPVSGVSLKVASSDHGNTPFNLSVSTFSGTVDTTQFPSLKLLQTALAGYKLLIEERAISRPEVITIIDYSLPSNKERLWVIDLIKVQVLFRCLVSHGRNSGELMAEKFSNIPGSSASSPGFYSTGETYVGKNGLSLALDGLENGINDNARTRSIVIHGADYVSDDFIRNNGRLGRSLGCPAVPVELSKEIIQTIKGGSCLFIYVPRESYTANSHIINMIASLSKR
jgi:hypothetical protein